PPRSTLFPYTTLFRSAVELLDAVSEDQARVGPLARGGGDRRGGAAGRRLGAVGGRGVIHAQAQTPASFSHILVVPNHADRNSFDGKRVASQVDFDRLEFRVLGQQLHRVPAAPQALHGHFVGQP